MVKKEIHKLGQYFTTNKMLLDYVLDLIHNNPDKILEPSMGRGDIISHILNHKQGVKFDTYEIDETIKFLDIIDRDEINFGDFLKTQITDKYDTIVGNPPFVKRSGGNLYIDFIEKCYHLLNDNGELIFIIPSEFLKLTCATTIINLMIDNGTFTHIFHPNNEKLFDEASIDVIVFRYCKNINLEKKILFNGIERYLINTNGIITFTDTPMNDKTTLNTHLDVYVGMVTGKEEVYKNEKYGNLNILNGKDKVDKYIFIDQFPTENLQLNEYMTNNKDILISRKIRKFNDENWFQWGAARNYISVKKNIGKQGIYIYTLTRNTTVAFVDTIQYFGGNLILLIPKKDVDLNVLVKYLNSDEFKKNYMYAGRFKIGHKQVSNILFNFSNHQVC